MGRQRLAAGVALGLIQVVVIVTLALAGPDDSTHGAPVRIVAPPVVATSLVEAANAAAGQPLSARALATTSEARASVRAGRSVAAVVVDLSKEGDIVYMASANGQRLNRAVQREVDKFESAFGRTAVVQDLVPAKAGDEGHRRVYWLAGIAVLSGLAVAIAITWRRGPQAETLLEGTRRFVVAGLAALIIGGVIGAFCASYYDSGFGVWWLLASLGVLSTTMTTLALEALFGVVGIGVATTIMVLTAAPLVRLVSPLMLPQPWSTITPWLPHGALLEGGASQAYFGGDQILRPLLVLVAWTMLAVLTLIDARRERQKELSGQNASG